MILVDHIVVYGTLRQGERANDIIRKSAKFINTIVVNGQLYDLGAYPGAKHIDSSDSSFVAELWEMDTDKQLELLARLDNYEGYHKDSADSLYVRKVTWIDNVFTPYICEIPAYIYEYNRPTTYLGNLIYDWKNRPEKTPVRCVDGR